MSLLMDALRKAEQQKQQLAAKGRGQADPAAGSQQGLALEPISVQAEPEASPAASSNPESVGTVSFVPPVDMTPTKPGGPVPADIAGKPAKGRLPDLPTRLEDLDAQFMAHAAQPPLRAQPAAPAPPPPPIFAREKAPESTPDSARKLFEAKQPAKKSNRSFAIAVGLITLVAAVGIGGYFWWQLQPKSALVAGGAPVPPPAPAVPISPTAKTQPPVAITAPQPPQSMAAAPTAVPPAPTFPVPAAAPTAAPQDTLKPASQQLGNSEDAATPAKRAEPRPVQQAAAPASAKPESPIRLTTAQQKTNPLLEQAYQAFNRGDSTLAQANWQKVLAADPRNADALHGLAAIAQQRQQPNEAADYYLRALEVNPKDALALSGLVSLRTSANAEQTESRLKNMLAEQPDSPYLSFALGNLYARTTRWAEAQQSFFKAHTADPANPDYLFNLAVSLDQLHQPRLAVQYYNQALAAAARQPAGFDAAQIAARLKVLQPGL